MHSNIINGYILDNIRAHAPGTSFKNEGIVNVMTIRVLLVEDNDSYARLVESKLRSQGGIDVEVKHRLTMADALKFLDNQKTDLVMLDLNLPDSQGLGTFRKIHELYPDIPVIVLTVMDDDEQAVNAVKLGAQDYLVKGEVESGHLTRAIRYAYERNQEIIARNEADAALQREKERLAVTLRSIGDGVIATDTEGRVILLNKMAEKLTLWSQEDAIGRPVDEVFNIVDDASGQRKANPVREAIESDAIIGLEQGTILIARGRQTFRYVSASCSPIKDKDEIIIGVVLVFRDITERKKLEDELLKAQKLESISVLAAGIAHDFNNLLTAIMGNISLYNLQDVDRTDLVTRLEMAQKACVQAQELSSQLLTFSKSGTPVKRVPSSIEKILCDTARFATSGSSVKLKYDIDKNTLPVEIDRVQIGQVVSNILINSLQAIAQDGEITIKAENISASREKGIPLSQGAYVKITIEDNGIGIPREYMSKIFDPFFTTKQHGSGLGLATAYSIIKNHGGHLAVESELHTGTRVYIHLPATDKDIYDDTGSGSSIRTGRGRVLVMDDRVDVRQATGDMLTSIGYQVEYARDGAETLRLYKDAKDKGRAFDTVIMDLTVPGGMGGKETMEKLLAIDPGVKAVVSSGYSNDPVIASFKDYGFKAFLMKPYEVKQLSSVIYSVIENQ